MVSSMVGGGDGFIAGPILSVVPAPDNGCALYYAVAIPPDTNPHSNFTYQLLCSTEASPQTDSNLDVSEIQQLASGVSAHPEIRLATRDDNPCPPKNQSY